MGDVVNVVNAFPIVTRFLYRPLLYFIFLFDDFRLLRLLHMTQSLDFTDFWCSRHFTFPFTTRLLRLLHTKNRRK